MAAPERIAVSRQFKNKQINESITEYNWKFSKENMKDNKQILVHQIKKITHTFIKD